MLLNQSHRYGPSFNVLKKTAKVRNVTDVTTGSSTWWENLRDFGGWGIRFGQVNVRIHALIRPCILCVRFDVESHPRMLLTEWRSGAHLVLQFRVERRLGSIHV